MMVGSNGWSRAILPWLTAESIGAEIGVWRGDSSQLFLMCPIKELHLVDSWHLDAYRDALDKDKEFRKKFFERYKDIVGGVTSRHFLKYYDQVYKEVVERFSNEPRAIIYRMTSDEWFEDRETNSLDWIYLDGSHKYEGVKKDLINALRVVKPGGNIFGDDYSWRIGGPGKPGVTQAVNEVVEENSLTLIQHGPTQIHIPVE